MSRVFIRFKRINATWDFAKPSHMSASFCFAYHCQGCLRLLPEDYTTGNAYHGAQMTRKLSLLLDALNCFIPNSVMYCRTRQPWQQFEEYNFGTTMGSKLPGNQGSVKPSGELFSI